MDRLLNAVHAFLAADVPGLDNALRMETASALLQRWGVAAALKPESVLLASDTLQGWIRSNWPDSNWRRELPLLQRLAQGTTLGGTADLVLEMSDQYIVIDHRTFPGRFDTATGHATDFAGQLAAYGEALQAATDKPVHYSYIHMPDIGIAVKIETSTPHKE